MNEIVNNFLVSANKFILEIHLKKPRFTYSACGPLTANKEKTEKFIQTGNTDFIYKNSPDKACFKYNMAYGKSKDLAKRTQSDKVLRDKAFRIASDAKFDSYQRRLASMVFKFFNKKSSGGAINFNVNSQMNFISRLLKNSRKEKFIHLLETIFWVLILVICNP